MKKNKVIKADVKIGDEFVVNYGYKYVFERHIVDIADGNQVLDNGVILDNMLNKPFTYHNPKIGDIIEIVDLEKKLTPGHSEPFMFTFKTNERYYSTNWSDIKELIK